MKAAKNIQALHKEIHWLEQVIHNVISRYLQHEGEWSHWTDLAMPEEDDSIYQQWIQKNSITQYQRLALALAMTPQLKPEVLDVFFGKNQLYDRGFTEFGGILDANHSGFLPTGQTLLFLITATEPELRYEVTALFDTTSIFSVEQILLLENIPSHIPKLNGILTLNKRWLAYFETGEMQDIEQSAEFPAKRITTHLEWEDVVLNDIVMDQVLELKTWLLHGDELMNDWGLYKKVKRGYRTLFYGPPGTGKTLTVTLLGKVTDREVYRVDLSMIVSKYIGETEKNLSKIFDIAEHKNWILFFDEADALFGKRTEANSSNDRHANQQTSYLLQRIEDFPGVVILASNLKTNMDAAFTRRFQSMIHFTMPAVNERYQLWKNAFTGTCTLHSDINLWKIAEEYELAGGAIINVLRFCALSAIQRNDTVVLAHELIEGIRKEFKKENKTVTVF
ncbi:ATP-binding protein [Tenacibaculum tangerinum]|uniref:ATP-binding protein n=1 Tax=Tenacibaculum tangerinum TaxID=3038772 RepID=A0ABY8L2P4_9FLAO|nr:ATP-binding protein [Tenacibaculum tangerinum]WGH75713.1 ATP-binding protein [Tenacibaculum tangerinum]